MRACLWVASREKTEGRTGSGPRPDRQNRLPCCTMQHMDKTLSSPYKKPPRVSVPVTPELLATFERMGRATNQGTGAAIAEWLTDTHEAAEFMAKKLEEARAAPKVVMREMHAYALGLADETGALMRKINAKGKADGRGGGHGAALHADAAGGVVPPPPSCNTGGKVPSKTPTRGGKSS